MIVKRGIAICHYNRNRLLKQSIKETKRTCPEGAKIVVCDDGSSTSTPDIKKLCIEEKVPLIIGPNLGVTQNKNRALFALQDCHFIALLEDDICPLEPGWFELYEQASLLSGVHHFCRAGADAAILESPFDSFMKSKGLTILHNKTIRGDFTFITNKIIKNVGGLNSEFKGAGYSHIEWLNRIRLAGLVPQHSAALDVKEASVKLKDSLTSKSAKPTAQTEQEASKNLEIFKRLCQNPTTYQEFNL